MKTQRGTSVNGVKENCRGSMINKGGTAELSVPYGMENFGGFLFLIKKKRRENYEIKKSCW